MTIQQASRCKRGLRRQLGVEHEVGDTSWHACRRTWQPDDVQRPRITSQRAFTLVELLIVVLILGLLTALALPRFLGQREQANDSKAKQALEVAVRASKAAYLKDEVFPSDLTADLSAGEPAIQFVDGVDYTEGAVSVYRHSGSRITLRTRSKSGKALRVDIDEQRSDGDSVNRTIFAAGLSPIANLVSNPSAEADDNGWISWLGRPGTISRVPASTSGTGWAPTGQWAMRYQVTNVAGPTTYGMVNPSPVATPASLRQWAIPVVAGQQYSVSAEAFVISGANGGVTVQVRFLSASGGIIADLPTVYRAGLGAKSITGMVTAPAGAQYATLGLVTSLGAAGQSADVLWDAVQITPASSVQPYLDGDMAGAEWQGERHRSPSGGLPNGRSW